MSKKLAAYFSASGVTAKLAKKLAAAIGADLHQIIPAEPYTPADLDWTNKKSRSSIEMNNKKFRPAISGTTPDMDKYDVIYIGFPIWWYVAPTIINTFLVSCDITGKIIIPFATSGGSGMGNTNSELAPSCKGAILKNGRRFSANASTDELKAWSKEVEEQD